MLRLLELQLGVLLAVSLGSVTALAQTRPTRVLVRALERDRDTVARLMAELQSDGFSAQRITTEEPPPCAPEATHMLRAPGGAATPVAAIEIDRDASGALLIARICHVTAPERAVVSAPVAAPDRLALAAVEALNGLTASPSPTARDLRESPPEPAERDSASAPLALDATALLVLQPSGGRPLAGTSVAIAHSVHPRWALALEVFMPIGASSADGPDRELSIAAAWARFGARGHTSLAWLKAGASLHTGMALVWATARTRDPSLIGGTELAKAAVLSAGLWLESPGDSLVYLRTTAQATRLLPSARVELGGGRSQGFGNLLVEIGLGIGVRWPQPESEPP